MLNFMGDMAAFPDPAVLKSSFDAVWTGNICDPPSQFYNWWFEQYKLQIVDLELPFIGVQTCVVWTIGRHLEFNLFRLTEDYDEPPPCPYTSGYFTLPPA